MDKNRNTVKDDLPFLKPVMISFNTCIGQSWASTAPALASGIPSILTESLICHKGTQFLQSSTQLCLFMAATKLTLSILYIFIINTVSSSLCFKWIYYNEHP